MTDIMERARAAVSRSWSDEPEDFADKLILDLVVEIERLRASNKELVRALQRLLQFNEELCADIGVSKHYPSAEQARGALAKALLMENERT